MQPYRTLNFCVALAGVFPSPNQASAGNAGHRPDGATRMSTPFLGEVLLFGFNFVPQDWHACDGILLSIAQNDALFALLGTTYGGDGQTSFAVPDLRGQVPLHQGKGPGLTPRVIGEGGGSETVTLAVQQLGAHGHAFAVTSAVASTGTPSGSVKIGRAHV